MTFGENLKKYRQKLNMTRADLAYRITTLYGFKSSNANVQSWESGANPKIKTIIALADILGIPEQFLFDDSTQAMDAILREKMPSVRPMVSNTLKVDMLSGYIGAGSLGHLVGMDEIADVMYVDKMAVSKKYHHKKLRSILVIGDSMIPYVDAGDIVIFCDFNSDMGFMDGKYVITAAHGTMIKNLCFKSNGDIVISSCNKVYESETIKADESQDYIEIIGMVVGRILKS
ncbi:MAG TPA: LexA family transcriptional regulator [Sulfurimonas autotrophica]|nr:LexA family transcriptional regulator [Sulfurimonas autotrophica]